MNILMMTNTYLPHVGGVARSVDGFSQALRARGHAVLVVAPSFSGAARREAGIIRVPAIQRFNGSDFSLRLPVPGLLSRALDRFEPDLVHSHHPFLLGDAALRVATRLALPLVFTHHTMYERYTHYVPGDSPALRRFVIAMAREYANLCDAVIAPSESIGRLLADRGVQAPIRAIPTGVDVDRFRRGNGARVRARLGIAPSAFVVGHVGRLAHEKNLPFLATAVAGFLRRHPDAHFLVVGAGPSADAIRAIRNGSAARVHLTGSLQGQDLVDAYHAMDVFAFASHTETQGMVLAEAMAAAVPVVALDAPGVREVVRDGRNGRLLPNQDAGAFAAALDQMKHALRERRDTWKREALLTATDCSLERCTDRLLDLYGGLDGSGERDRPEETPWAQVRRRLETEWEIWSGRAEAAVDSLRTRA